MVSTVSLLIVIAGMAEIARMWKVELIRQFPEALKP